MEQKHICATICDRLPTLSANHPWFVIDRDRNLEDTSIDHVVYTMRDPPSQYRCRIPSFLGRRIWGCFHGWVILSNHPRNDMWCLWNPNPNSCKIIRLPRLISKNGLGNTQECCLSAPPDDPAGSILMVTADKYAIVFCRLDFKRKRLRWVEMSYAKQLRSIVGYDGVLCCLTCCNGKVYALNSAPNNFLVIHIDIVVKGRETVISLLPYLKHPYSYINGCNLNSYSFLKGCCTELFYIQLGLINVGYVEKRIVGGVQVFKLDMTKIRWQKMEDLKGAAFFFDLAHDCTMHYSPAIAPKLGGYVHFLDLSGKIIHSYDFKNKAIALSSMPTPYELLSEHRLQGDRGEIKSQQEGDRGNEMVVRNEEVNSNSTGTEDSMESRLLGIPFDVLKAIIEFCVGVEYLNFRSTCKICHLAAPMIRWRKGGRLKTYSLASPWLMVLDNEGGVISLTDPQFGDKYFINKPQELIGDFEIHGSVCGWLLIRTRETPLMFFNPFTGDIRVLPFSPHFDTCCFSAPPTSSDCMVVGFTTRVAWHVYIHFVARESSWQKFRLNFCFDDPRSFHFATHCGHNLYALYCNGGVGFIDTDKQDYTWQEGPSCSCSCSCRSPKHNFLMKCDQQLLLVKVGQYGECVEVFKMNDSKEWEKTESLGRHSVYVCGKSCLCIEAKTPEMANKIYFPRLHSENRKIVFYSLETRRYHTFNGQDTESSFGDFMGTEHHLGPHVWIEPSWS